MSGNFHWQTTEYVIQQRFYQQQYGLNYVATKAMVTTDVWTSNAAKIFRLLPLLISHPQNHRVQTHKERVTIIPATPTQYNIILSLVSLYFLLGSSMQSSHL